MNKSKPFHYAGIGSRKTPPEILKTMEKVAQWLALGPFVLNSGAAAGADSAFEKGCDENGGSKRIWLAWNGSHDRYKSEPDVYAMGESQFQKYSDVVSQTHPYWDSLKPGAKKLHARNYAQVMDSRFVVCYTPDGCDSELTRTKDSGGTATAIVLADRVGMPVFNLYHENSVNDLISFVKRLMRPAQSFSSDIKKLKENEVFVFGSNFAGRHGAGTAKFAKDNFGAIDGIGYGPQGQSFAIPTKDGRNNQDLSLKESVLGLEQIAEYVRFFVTYARKNPDKTFYISAIGCGLAGYTPQEIAPLFRHAKGLSNCFFDKRLAKHIDDDSQYMRINYGPKGINIFSGAGGLGSKLTNPTQLAKKKEFVAHTYPIEVEGHQYRDLEDAYKKLKTGDFATDDALMVYLINKKFNQYPELVDEVQKRGGISFLKKCSHNTFAKTAQAQSWEGVGVGSRFIKNLIDGWVLHETGYMKNKLTLSLAPAQEDLFGNTVTPKM